MARLYTFDAAALSGDDTFNEYLSKASAFRREKMEALKFPGAKRLSLAAAAALDAGLWELGLREADMSYGVTELGKPYFANRPDICFSLSHSGMMAAAALSSSPVGCDIEALREANFKVAQRFFHPSENEYISSQNDKTAAFWRLWTLKESFVKATGDGIAKATFNSFCIIPEDGKRFARELPGGRYEFTERTVGDYYIAVCETVSGGGKNMR